MKQNMESIRRIIKEEINKSDEDIIGKESDGMEWIKNVKSNQDIAQEIADETKIKNGLLHTPFPLSPPPFHPPLSSLPPFPSLLLPFSFTKYGKELYGLDNEDDINDIWERYKILLYSLISNNRLKELTDKSIKESNGLQWIKDVVNIKLAKNEDWILVNDIDRESITEGHEIQKYLFDLGYDWGIGDFDSLKDFCIYTIYHFGDDKDVDQIYYHSGCRNAEVRISDKDIKKGKHMIYYWSDLKIKH
jgi:hypothetical protein